MTRLVQWGLVLFKLMSSTAVCGILASLPSAPFVTNPVIVPRPALSPATWPGSGAHPPPPCVLLFRPIIRWRGRRRLFPLPRLFLMLSLLYMFDLLLHVTVTVTTVPCSADTTGPFFTPSKRIIILLLSLIQNSE